MTKVIEATKKPIKVQAFNWVGHMGDADALKEFLGYIPVYSGSLEAGFSVLIETLEGTMQCKSGAYIIKGVKGEFYPCDPEIFHQTYEWDVD